MLLKVKDLTQYCNGSSRKWNSTRVEYLQVQKSKCEVATEDID